MGEEMRVPSESKEMLISKLAVEMKTLKRKEQGSRRRMATDEAGGAGGCYSCTSLPAGSDPVSR